MSTNTIPVADKSPYIDTKLSASTQQKHLLTRLASRYLHLVHRWLGIFIGLFVLLWFFSGAVMMYVAYPELTKSEKYQASTPINYQLVKLNAQQAWNNTGIAGLPEQVHLSNAVDKPCYYFLFKNRWYAVWADTGKYRQSISKDEAIASAQAFIKNTNAIKQIELIDYDQWSVSSSLNIHRPLYRINTADKDNSILYISSHTGEMVRDTTAWERGWNWVGAVIHWIYMAPLRMLQQPWRQVVMWTSAIAFVLAITGLWLGIQRLKLRRRYSANRITPYRGWKKWHHLAGLIGAVFAATWIFSGWLSVNPFGLFPSSGLSEQEQSLYDGIEVNSSLLNTNAAMALASVPETVEVSWKQIGKSGFLIMQSRFSTKIIDINKLNTPLNKLSESFLIKEVQAMKPKVSIKQTLLVTEGDLYYYNHHAKKPLPVIRIDFADDAETSVYINPITGNIETSENNSSRLYRWLFSGLHCLDFPPLIKHRPLWDLIVIMLLIIGSALSVSGMYLAVKRIRR